MLANGICLIALLLGQAPAKALDDSPAYKEPDSILYAARKGDLPRVQLLLGKQPQLLDSQDDFKRTPLLYAAKAGHAKVVQYLLKQGSKSVYLRDFYDFTPVHWAAMYAKNDVLKVFAEHKVDLNCRGMDGQIPLHMAMGNMFSNTPKHEETVKLLVSLKADVNAQDNNGRAPLHVGACLWGKAESVRALLDNGKEVKVDIRSKDGGTALHTAAAFGRVDIAEMLLAKGANPTLKRDDGKTPIDLANECVVDSRREAIVRVFAQLKNGKTTSGSSGDR
jgi:ankyrin repeat protein